MTEAQGIGTESPGGGEAIHTKDVAARVGGLAEAAADAVKEDAGVVAAKVKEQAEGQMAQGRETASKALKDMAAAVRTAGEELSRRNQSLPKDWIDGAAGKLEGLAGSVAEAEPGDLIRSGRAFARSNPIPFAAASLLAGYALGRLVQGAAKASMDRPQSPAGSAPQTVPVAPTAPPAVTH